MSLSALSISLAVIFDGIEQINTTGCAVNNTVRLAVVRKMMDTSDETIE